MSRGLQRSSRPVGFLNFVSHQRSLNLPAHTTLTTDQLARQLQADWLALPESAQQTHAQLETEANAISALATFDEFALVNGHSAENKRKSPSSDGTATAGASPSTMPSPSAFNFYEPLKLENLRNVLIRLEESIIFALIERAQFKLNSAIYESRCMPQFNGLSFLNYFLYETEKLHAKVRRYTSPDEHPFAHPSTLPTPILPQLKYPVSIKSNQININATIQTFYIQSILPAICKAGDDQNYGSSATCDIACLQLLSKRIHYGKFVAESKFRQEPVMFATAIQKRDVATLMELITKPIVEEQVLHRVHMKAATYGSDLVGTPGNSPQVQPIVIPTSKPLSTSMSPLLLLPLKSSQSYNELNSVPAPTTISLDAVNGSDTNGANTSSSSSLSANNTNGNVSSMSLGSGSIASERGMSGYGISTSRFKISPDVIAHIYARIMQLNKDVQIEYLLHRLE